jgi:hypothetical protein
MSMIKNFLEKLANEKWLVYFLLLWAGVFFFWSLSGVVYRVANLTNAYSGVMLFYDLIELGAGVMLALLGFKLLNNSFLASMKKEMLLTYFLLLWAGYFFFGGIADIAYDAQYGVTSASDFVGILGILCELGAGAVLALFAWKLYQAKSEDLPPPPPSP